jgi:chemotaxis protein MotB
MAADSNEWIPIGDLMAGVVGVVMVMFVSAAVVSTEQANHARRQESDRQRAAQFAATVERERLRRAAEQQRASIRVALEAFRADVTRTGDQEMVLIDPAAGRTKFRDVTFARGSACVQPRARARLVSLAQTMRQLLEERANRTIRVEGHTDSVPVLIRLDHLDRCALFDDNFMLSAARARQARLILTDGWPEALKRRVTLAGLGDTHPLVADLTSPENRRVEISVEDDDTMRSGHDPSRPEPSAR